MKIAVISDIHSNLDAFQAVVANLPHYDSLLFLGDLVGYGPQPDEVVEQLQQLNPGAALMGNHDYAVVTGDTSGFSQHAEAAVKWTRRHITQQTNSYLSTLHPMANIYLNSRKLALFHGSPRDPLNEYIFPGIPGQLARMVIERTAAQIVLLGHTHMPMLYSFADKMLANPGSVGQPRDGDPRAAFAVLTISESKFAFEIKRVEYDVDAVANKIIEAGLPRFLADRLFTGI